MVIKKEINKGNKTKVLNHFPQNCQRISSEEKKISTFLLILITLFWNFKVLGFFGVGGVQRKW